MFEDDTVSQLDLRHDDRWSSNPLEVITKLLVLGTSHTGIVLNQIWLLGLAFTIIEKLHKSLPSVLCQLSSEDSMKLDGNL